jgi:hypothetical protein
MRDALWNAPGTEVAMLSTRTLAVGTGIVIVAAWLGASMPRAGAQAPERLGKVNFPTSCSPALQAQFERAVALEHSFWFDQGIQRRRAGRPVVRHRALGRRRGVAR